MIHGLVIIILALLPLVGHARKVQILHTNDLHSFFAGTRTGKGGYAKLKTKLLELRQKAQLDGIKTLHLDAGDFGEGSSFFLSNEGVASLKALDMLGVDVSVIGNHDFMLGGPALAEQIKRAELKTKILSANLQFKNKLKLDKLVQDKTDIHIDGINLRVIGLTTHEIHFQYPLRPKGYISSAHNEGLRQAKIGGSKIRDLKKYTLAFPSEVVHAIEKIIPFMTPMLFPKSELTTTYYWPMIEGYVKDNSPIRCLN